MSDDDATAEGRLADAVSDDSRSEKDVAATDQAETAAWHELGDFEDVKKRLGFARIWENRAKENAEAAKKLAELQDAQKTADEKTAERLAAAEKELHDYKIREIRAAAARAAGLDADMAQFLTETEPDAALAQAKVLAKRVQAPRVDLKQGSRTAHKPTESMDAWLRRAAGYPPS